MTDRATELRIQDTSDAQSRWSLAQAFLGVNDSGNKVFPDIYERQRIHINYTINVALRLIVDKLVFDGILPSEIDALGLLNLPVRKESQILSELGVSSRGHYNRTRKDRVVNAMANLGWLVDAAELLPRKLEFENNTELVLRHTTREQRKARDMNARDAMDDYYLELGKYEAAWREFLPRYIAYEKAWDKWLLAYPEDSAVEYEEETDLMGEGEAPDPEKSADEDETPKKKPKRPKEPTIKYPRDPRVAFINTYFGKIVQVRDSGPKKLGRAMKKSMEKGLMGTERSENLSNKVRDLTRSSLTAVDGHAANYLDKAFEDVVAHYLECAADSDWIPRSVKNQGEEARTTGYVHTQYEIGETDAYHGMNYGGAGEVIVIDPNQLEAKALTSPIYHIIRHMQTPFGEDEEYYFDASEAQRIGTPEKVPFVTMEELETAYCNLIRVFAEHNNKPGFRRRFHVMQWPLDSGDQVERCRQMYWNLVELHRTIHAVAATAADAELRTRYCDALEKQSNEAREEIELFKQLANKYPDLGVDEPIGMYALRRKYPNIGNDFRKADDQKRLDALKRMVELKQNGILYQDMTDPNRCYPIDKLVDIRHRARKSEPLSELNKDVSANFVEAVASSKRSSRSPGN